MLAGPVRRTAQTTMIQLQDSDAELVERLRQADEAAFTAIVHRYHPAMVRVAGLYVADRDTAEDVAQETWLAVLGGIAGFQGRASFKTWLFRILTNTAKSRGRRDRRVVPFSELLGAAGDEPAVAPGRFLPADHPQAPGHWASPPADWGDLDGHLERLALRQALTRAIGDLPPGQRQVLSLRDVDGWSAAEVCNVLGLSEVNQRVLLHRARSKVRRALEAYVAGSEPNA
jgi:RNA polymerase sigma-70 factor (ECF subfamily)